MAQQRATGAETGTVPEPRTETANEQSLRLRVGYGARGTATITVTGDVDVLTAPRLGELVHCRLRSALRELVLDLSDVTFMSVTGARVLVRAVTLASHNDTDLRIELGSGRAVERVLRATGFDAYLPRDRVAHGRADADTAVR